MTSYVRISEGGDVIESINFDPVGTFHPSLVWWPLNSLEEKREAKKVMATRKRYVRETGGISLGGMTVATDRESQALITGAFTRAKDKLEIGQPDDLIDFRGLSGWVQLDIPTVLLIGRAVGDHVQACFANERVLHDALDAAADDTELEAIDMEAGWPPG